MSGVFFENDDEQITLIVECFVLLVMMTLFPVLSTNADTTLFKANLSDASFAKHFIWVFLKFMFSSVLIFLELPVIHVG